MEEFDPINDMTNRQLHTAQRIIKDLLQRQAMEESLCDPNTVRLSPDQALGLAIFATTGKGFVSPDWKLNLRTILAKLNAVTEGEQTAK